MPNEFKLPDLGEGIHEGEVVEVLVSVGDNVEDGQSILILETDKATTEVPAPVTGVVKEIKVKPGDVVNVGDVMMVFDEVEEGEPATEEKEEAAREEPAAEEPAAEEKQRAKQQKSTGEKEPAAAAKKKAPEPEAKAEPAKREAKGPVPAAPSTRRLARELGVDLHQVTPSGAGGRVTDEDVRTFAEQAEQPAAGEEERPAEAAPAKPAAAAAPSLPDFSQWGEVERMPLRSIRRATAKHMAQAWAQIPHVTHEDVADVTELEAFRRKHKDDVAARGGSLSMTVLVMKAVVAGLKAQPRFNASLDTANEEIILKHYYHLGVAVDTDRGLIVPTIRDVDRKSIIELSIELKELIDRVRGGDVNREDTVGGTFTITNVGPLGGTALGPIINYPQVAILGMAQARLQPVVHGDEDRFQIVPRRILPLVVGFDHRVVDGADAARFLNVVIEALESPDKLFMMM